MSLLARLFNGILKWGGFSASTSNQQREVQSAHSPPAVRTSPPGHSAPETLAPPGQIAESLEALHAPLLDRLASYPRTHLSGGLIVFHGCNSGADHIDVIARRLSGTRKWVTQDAAYACDYGGAYGNQVGRSTAGLLWVARLRADIPALEGSQLALQVFSPWGAKFPWMFPDAYDRYAQAVLKVDGPKALLQHASDLGYREILITAPEQALDVLDVIELPKDPEESRALGRKVAERYLSLIP